MLQALAGLNEQPSQVPTAPIQPAMDSSAALQKCSAAALTSMIQSGAGTPALVHGLLVYCIVLICIDVDLRNMAETGLSIRFIRQPSNSPYPSHLESHQGSSPLGAGTPNLATAPRRVAHEQWVQLSPPADACSLEHLSCDWRFP